MVCSMVYSVVNNTHMRTMVLEYAHLQNWAIFGVNVGVHIPAPWVASGIDIPSGKLTVCY